ncbi:O-methyltransferase [Actinoalloteichus cyanogriseus DSM 43889]|uniref:O-methyltransferase n=1 Tax=Actinoalloteichus caeruleus DSM 43889 TaxID=1120930 RepID=A0ABT1JCG3_ACTCY|nr:O-methyltransferase [Actinoalloteichus caeruleus DSM 43889]
MTNPATRATGLGDRCETSAGDCFTAVPPGRDLYPLKSIMRGWDDDRAATILRCRRGRCPRPGKC